MFWARCGFIRLSGDHIPNIAVMLKGVPVHESGHLELKV
jgi:hypothetical protein